MVVAGGAGPNHACAIAAELDLPLFLVPRESSIFCAAGMLMTDLKHDVVRSLVVPLDEMSRDDLEAASAELAEQGRSILRGENVPEGRIRILAEADRYDRLVFDTAPTGQTLRLLSLPEMLGAWIGGLVERRRKVAGLGRMWRSVAGDSAGSEPAHEDPVLVALAERQLRFQETRQVLMDARRLRSG